MTIKALSENQRHANKAHALNRIDRHKLPVCAETGLARHRDRRQARDAARAFSVRNSKLKATSYSCPSCKGFHLDRFRVPKAPDTTQYTPPTDADELSANRTRRYVLLDIENLTRGARATREEVSTLWSILSNQVPGIDTDDHVVVGAAVNVARKYRPALQAGNIKWVVGANAPDGADQALLSTVNLHQVSKQFDELMIASGDHAFAPLAAQAKLHGLRVHVVTAENPSGRLTLSRELSDIADVRTLIRFPLKAPMSATGQILRQIHLATAA